MNHSQLPPVLRRWRFVAAAMGLVAVAGGGVLLAANADPATAMAFHPVASTRLLDTRPATQVGTRSTPLGLLDSMDLVVAGLPDDATAVQINVTVVDGTEGSFLTIYPTNLATRPNVSTINWLDAGAVANSATVNVAADHTLRIFNLKGTANVVIDLLGFYAPSPVGGAAGAPGADGISPGPETNDGSVLLALDVADSVTLVNVATGPTGTDSVVLNTVPRGGTDPELNAWMVVESMADPADNAYVTNTVAETLLTGAPVTFDTVDQANGIIADPGGSEIQILTAGVYKFSFAVVAVGGSQLQILVNGVAPATGALVFGART